MHCTHCFLSICSMIYPNYFQDKVKSNLFNQYIQMLRLQGITGGGNKARGAHRFPSIGLYRDNMDHCTQKRGTVCWIQL